MIGLIRIQRRHVFEPEFHAPPLDQREALGPVRMPAWSVGTFKLAPSRRTRNFKLNLNLTGVTRNEKPLVMDIKPRCPAPACCRFY